MLPAGGGRRLQRVLVMIFVGDDDQGQHHAHGGAAGVAAGPQQGRPPPRPGVGGSPSPRALPAERAASRWIVSTDPDEHVERLAETVDLGFTHLVFHAPGPDQRRFLDLYAKEVLPRLRERG